MVDLNDMIYAVNKSVSEWVPYNEEFIDYTRIKFYKMLLF